MSTRRPQQIPPPHTRTDGNWDPRYARPLARRTFLETKSGFRSSEFYVMLLFVAGVLVATYADGNGSSRDHGWILAGLAVAAYILSRGLAKLGTQQSYEKLVPRDIDDYDRD